MKSRWKKNIHRKINKQATRRERTKVLQVVLSINRAQKLSISYLIV